MTTDRHPLITCVTPGFPPDTGGVEEHVSRLVAGVAGRGHPVTVLTASRRVRRRTVEHLDDGVTVITYPAWRSQTLSLSPRLLVGTLKYARHSDVFHVHSYHALNSLATLAARRPVLTPHYHGQQGHSRLAHLLHKAYRIPGRRMMRRASAIICVSDAERAVVCRDFPEATELTVTIPNGVRVQQIQDAQPFRGEPRTVLVLGRLVDYKGVDTILDAYSRIGRSDLQLVIVGDGPARNDLEEQATALRISDRVRFTGRLSDADVDAWLRTADVLVSMSAHEAFGIVPLEAAAAGARVVVSDIAAHREIVRRYVPAASVVPLGDVDVLASAIEVQLDAPPTAAPSIPTWQQVTDATLQVYDDILPVIHTAIR